jgi:hypothetical protein
MAVLRKIFRTNVAIAVALTICAPSSAIAQAGGAAPAARRRKVAVEPVRAAEAHKAAVAEAEAALRCTPRQPAQRTLRQSCSIGLAHGHAAEQ